MVGTVFRYQCRSDILIIGKCWFEISQCWFICWLLSSVDLMSVLFRYVNYWQVLGTDQFCHYFPKKLTNGPEPNWGNSLKNCGKKMRRIFESVLRIWGLKNEGIFINTYFNLKMEITMLWAQKKSTLMCNC